MNNFKYLAYSFCNLIPFNSFNRIIKNQVLFPYHHIVSNQYLPHIRGLYNYKNENQFIKELEHLLIYRKVLHPHQLVESLNEGKPFPSNSFLLTFDDGFKETSEIIAPILLRYGIPAIFFINPSFIDNKELFYRCKLSLVIEKIKNGITPEAASLINEYLQLNTFNMTSCRKKILSIHYPEKHKADELGKLLDIDFASYLQLNKPFLSTNDLVDLARKGFNIGAHSMGHPNYALISEDEQILETISSIKFVKEKTKEKYNFFSFPHLDKNISKHFFTKVFEEGPFKPDLIFGVQNLANEIENRTIHRYNAENPETSLKTSTIAITLYNMFKIILGGNKIQRK